MSAPYRPTGVIPACLMPFDGELRIDEAAYRSHLRDLAGVDGVTAITINGHAAEVHALTFDEQRRALEVAMDELQGAVPVIVGVSSTGSQEAARLAAMAAEGGASGLLVFPPESMSMGGQLRPEMAMAHYGRIVDATDLPLILFQYPLPGGLGYPLQTMLSLCQKYPTIRGIKDWCNDPALHERHIRELHALENPVAVLSTHSAWLLGSLVMGCDGLLSGAGSVVANLQVALFRAVQADDLATARRLSDRLYPITRAFYGAPFLDMHNRMKEALVMLGRLPAAHVRPPLMKLSADEIQSIRRFLEQAEITPATVYQPVT
ncbi:MAG: dihydrodipicolinate synthase family protein [Planctomycetaceae bacterium]|nr:dihydrodipicolinate synthase family protein [Planctomycetaceae bacterium]